MSLAGVRRWIVSGIACAVVLVWLLGAFPLITVPLLFRAAALLLFAVAMALWHIPLGGKRRAFRVFIVAMFMAVTPVEISVLSYPGPPRLVPFVMGLPGRDLVERAKMGEVVLGGCVVTGFEPRWVLVW